MSFGRQRRATRWELVTRKGCHLCDEMASELAAAGLVFASVDADSDPVLRARFGEVVPVLLRDGKPVAKVRVDGPKLRRLMRGKR